MKKLLVLSFALMFAFVSCENETETETDKEAKPNLLVLASLDVGYPNDTTKADKTPPETIKPFLSGTSELKDMIIAYIGGMGSAVKEGNAWKFQTTLNTLKMDVAVVEKNDSVFIDAKLPTLDNKLFLDAEFVKNASSGKVKLNKPQKTDPVTFLPVDITWTVKNQELNLTQVFPVPNLNAFIPKVPFTGPAIITIAMNGNKASGSGDISIKAAYTAGQKLLAKGSWENNKWVTK